MTALHKSLQKQRFILINLLSQADLINPLDPSVHTMPLDDLAALYYRYLQTRDTHPVIF